MPDILILNDPESGVSAYLVEPTPKVRDALKRWNDEIVTIYGDGPDGSGLWYSWDNPQEMSEEDLISDILQYMENDSTPEGFEEEPEAPEGFHLWNSESGESAFIFSVSEIESIGISSNEGSVHADRNTPIWVVDRTYADGYRICDGTLKVVGLTFEQALKVASDIPSPIRGQTRICTLQNYK